MTLLLTLQAIEMEQDHLFELNYAITLYNNEELERSRHHFQEFQRMFEVRPSYVLVHGYPCLSKPVCTISCSSS